VYVDVIKKFLMSIIFEFWHRKIYNFNLYFLLNSEIVSSLYCLWQNNYSFFKRGVFCTLFIAVYNKQMKNCTGVPEMQGKILTTSYWLHVELVKNI
jgi:hypothetical protein